MLFRSTKEAVKSDFGYHIIYRLPLSEAAIDENIAAHREALASEATNSYFAELSQNSTVTYTTDYEKYITTIK